MSEKIVQLNEEVTKGQIKELVRGSVEKALNQLLEAEAAKLTQAAATSTLKFARVTAAATMTETLPPPPETSPTMCPVSRASSSHVRESKKSSKNQCYVSNYQVVAFPITES